MIDAEVSLHVYSTVTGRTGNWSWATRMTLTAVPAAGDYIIWGTRDRELTDRVRLVYYNEKGLQDSQTPGIAIELDSLKTDSPDILNQAFEHHKDWKQYGGPWAGQEEA